DHARITEKIAQILADRRYGRCCRRTEVRQDDRSLHRRIPRLGDALKHSATPNTAWLVGVRKKKAPPERGLCGIPSAIERSENFVANLFDRADTINAMVGGGTLALHLRIEVDQRLGLIVVDLQT